MFMQNIFIANKTRLESVSMQLLEALDYVMKVYVIQKQSPEGTPLTMCYCTTVATLLKRLFNMSVFL